MTAFQHTIDEQGIARVVFDLPDEKVNKFSTAVMEELDALLDTFSENSSIRLLTIASAKKNIFIAGADITEIRTINSRDDAEDKGRRGQQVFSKLANLSFPTIALIDGACLGGGMEMSLACDYRVASDYAKTSLGLPEVNLGIIPGWGGTQRLPRLVGLQQSLTMILTGKPVDGSKAFRIGLADALVSHDFFAEQCEVFIQKCLEKRSKSALRKPRKRNLLTRFLENTPPGRKYMFKKSRENVLSKTKGQYPAQEAAIQVIEDSLDLEINQGLNVELKTFSDLAITPVCKNLIQVFFSNEVLKKNPGIETEIPGLDLNETGVLGAGIMGGGIAWLFANKDMRVRLKDIQWDAIAKGYQVANQYFGQLLKIRKLKPKQVNVKLNKLSGTLDYSGFDKLDVVVEAIVENMDVKKKVLAELEENVSDNAIICSNTSALSITEMQSVLKRPEKFVGMHFFNPVNRMPLVEIIPGEKTSEETIMSIVNLCKKVNKTAIVVGDCAGFLVNRILVPYMNEAALMLEEGAQVESIDKLILDFGMPMGPFQLTDEVGIDVGYHVAKILEDAYGERMKVAAILRIMLEDHKLLGKKDGKGFYTHSSNKKQKKQFNQKLEQIVSSHQQQANVSRTHLDQETVRQRTILTMVNEAAKCLEEKVVNSVEGLDMAMIMGTGFPPFRGGLLKYADSLGIDTVKTQLESLEARFGMRFKPAELIVKMTEEKKQFYGE